MSERKENLYDSLPQRHLPSQIVNTPPPLPPPRKSSVPAAESSRVVKTAEKQLSEYELDDLIDYLESSCSENSDQKAQLSESISEENRSVQFSADPVTEEDDQMKRITSSHLPGSPVPRPRSQKSSMSRSRSCDQLAQDAVKEKMVTNSHRKTTLIPSSSSVDDDVTSKQLVAVAPPIHPRSSKNGYGTPVSNPNNSPSSKAAKRLSIQTTLGQIATEMSRSLPLRIEMLEGYMSNVVPSVTFSASDIFNVHLVKQQEVIRVKDSLGMIYSIPLHSSIQIGLVNETGSDGSSKKGNTLHKTAKAGDIMAMKELPKIMCATRTVKASSGEKFSVEDKEILLVRGISRVPGNKKKKMVQALEVFSITKKMEKILFPDCTGQFTLSPMLTRLPIATLFKHMSHFTNCLPLHAYLFFKPEDILKNTGADTDWSVIPPPSLSQNLVMVEEKALETALIMSPHFESERIDVKNSENLLHILMDHKFEGIEVTARELVEHSERSQLYNSTCTIHENINLAKIKYYHSSSTALAFHTQTYLYSRCQSFKVGVKMDLPVWTEPPPSPASSATNSERSHKTEAEKQKSTASATDIQRRVASEYGGLDTLRTDLMGTKRNSEPLLDITRDTKCATLSSATRPHSPSPPIQHQSPPPRPLASYQPSLSHQSPPHPSQPHPLQPHPSPPSYNYSSAQALASASLPPSLLSSITSRVSSIKTDGVHRRFSDMDLDGGSCSQEGEGGSYSPRPDRKVRKSNSVKDTSVHSIAHRPPYLPPSPVNVADISPSLRVTGRDSRSLYRSPRSNMSASSVTTNQDHRPLHAIPSGDGSVATPSLTTPCPPIPPRDWSRSSNSSSSLSSTPSRPIPARIPRAAYENRTFDTSRSVPPSSGFKSAPSISGQTFSPYPQPQVSRPRTSESQSSLGSSATPENKSRRQAPGIPLPQLPTSSNTSGHAKDDDEDDDAGVYEEMKSITLTNLQGPPKPTPRTRNSGDKSDDNNYEGIDPKKLTRQTIPDDYEIFNPPISSHVMQEVNAKVKDLNKELEELKSQESASAEKIQSLEEKMTDMMSTLKEVTESIRKLELSSKDLKDPGDRGTVNAEAEKNKSLVQKLTCKELKMVLEGLNIGQYIPAIAQESIDGHIFMMLDENTLENELGVVSRLHRLKMMNLIRGSYNPESYIKEVSFQQSSNV